MSADYDPVRRLVQLGHPLLAAALRDGVECTIQVKGGGIFCIYKPRAVVNVDDEGQILLGDPAGYQLKLDPAKIRVSSGVSQLPANPSIAWERQKENLATGDDSSESKSNN